MKMDQSDRTNPPSRKRGLDWLDPSSAWAHSEYGAAPAAASEPYDWTLKDGETRVTQVIPITSPVRRRSTKFWWQKRKANVSESATLIPLEKGATRKLISKRITSLLRPASTSPLVENDRTGVNKQAPARAHSAATIPLVESDRTGAVRKSPGLALPLLLLVVIALFVFAYIAQK
jgi:hypothetical protein